MTLSLQFGTTPSPTDEVWSVSRLTHMVKRLVEGEMPPLWIRGEVVQFKAWPGSGHWYFNLRDRNCQVRCCMWSRDVPRRATPPREGTEVFVLGQPVIYEAKGEFQPKPLMLMREVDAMTPLLFKAFAKRHRMEVELVLTKPDSKNQRVDYYKVSLQDAQIIEMQTSMGTVPGGGAGDLENLAFVYKTLKWEHLNPNKGHSIHWDGTDA